MVQVGPCSAWVDQDDITAIGPVPDDITPAQWDDVAEAATAILFHLSGRRYAGECSATVRPSRRATGDRPRYYSDWLTLDGACRGVRNLNDPCCGSVQAVTLGSTPVTAITAVVIDGVTLDPGAYRLDGDRQLVRQDGGAWPACQDLDLPNGQPGTWSVAFTYGTVPDQAGLIACAELSRQIGLAISQNEKCRLPQRVQTITRQGVSMTLLDPQDFLDHGRTGIYLVDLWLKAVNPDGSRRRARVMSPDYGYGPTTVTT